MKTRYRISALCFDKQGICISQGENAYTKSHPIQKYFAEKVGRPHNIYLHAEIHAILRAKDRQIEYINIYRYNTIGHAELAKPCPICIEAMIAFGIKTVNYTTKNGWVYGKTPQELKDEYSKSK